MLVVERNAARDFDFKDSWTDETFNQYFSCLSYCQKSIVLHSVEKTTFRTNIFII